MLNVPPARIVMPPEVRRRVLAMIDGALASGELTLGRHGAALEEAFAACHASPYGVAVSSGTAALEIIFRCLGVAGREVVVPANTFVATAAAVLHAGGRPRLADVDASTMALSAATVRDALTGETAGVVMVHIGGAVSAEVEAIAELCTARGLFLVEDAAHAHGATFRGRPAGTFGVAAAFSFYPTKLVTGGEGGMILTADEGLRDEARIYRDQGKASFLGGDHVRLGSAWRMSELHAAVARAHLDCLDAFVERRRRVAAIYDAGLADLVGVEPMRPPAGSLGNYYKYPAMLPAGADRGVVKARLRERGVALSGEVYAVPLHRQPALAGVPHADLAVTEAVCARHVCLPIHSDMADEEAKRVLTTLQGVVG